MTKEPLNQYGDARHATKGHFGVDIAMQRADDLDQKAIERVRQVGEGARALDVGSATGGQALRMAKAGATVFAMDAEDYTAPFLEAAKADGVLDRSQFVQADVTQIDVAARLGKFDVIVCQRMIHYLPHATALAVLTMLKESLQPDGCLYLSASGLYSELGYGYSAARQPVASRYAPLADAMAQKHAIRGPVCLYSVADLAILLEAAGLLPEQVYTSPFGNIKAVARA